jgi:PleD family two-component response regulator
LIDVFNRRHFADTLQILFAQAQRAGRPLSLLFADLDRFKQI